MGNPGRFVRTCGVGLCGLLLVLAFGVSASPAAKAVKVKTKAGEIFVDADSVSGSLSSGHDECEQGRQVKLRQASGDKVVGSAKTNKKGDWDITLQLPAGSYYAQAPKASKRASNGNKLSCGAAKSKTVVL